jgi:hypothetical protein
MRLGAWWQVYPQAWRRIGADHLGHAKPSMTRDVYMARGKVHTEVAEGWMTQ